MKAAPSWLPAKIAEMRAGLQSNREARLYEAWLAQFLQRYDIDPLPYVDPRPFFAAQSA